MISDVDINDWSRPGGTLDKESQEAYLKWAEDYGIIYEPWIGQPDVAAAFKAGLNYMKERYERAIRANGLSGQFKDLF